MKLIRDQNHLSSWKLVGPSLPFPPPPPPEENLPLQTSPREETSSGYETKLPGDHTTPTCNTPWVRSARLRGHYQVLSPEKMSKPCSPAASGIPFLASDLTAQMPLVSESRWPVPTHLALHGSSLNKGLFEIFGRHPSEGSTSGCLLLWKLNVYSS